MPVPSNIRLNVLITGYDNKFLRSCLLTSHIPIISVSSHQYKNVIIHYPTAHLVCVSICRKLTPVYQVHLSQSGALHVQSQGAGICHYWLAKIVNILLLILQV